MQGASRPLEAAVIGNRDKRLHTEDVYFHE
jgi:hypothetical protein